MISKTGRASSPVLAYLGSLGAHFLRVVYEPEGALAAVHRGLRRPHRLLLQPPLPPLRLAQPAVSGVIVAPSASKVLAVVIISKRVVGFGIRGHGCFVAAGEIVLSWLIFLKYLRKPQDI